MALLSKFLTDFGSATGIPALAISRTLYSVAIVGYIYNVAIPEWKKSGKTQLQKNSVKKGPQDEDEKVQEIAKQVSQHHGVEEERKPKGPAVNRYISLRCHWKNRPY